jgi:beta-lactamase class A
VNARLTQSIGRLALAACLLAWPLLAAALDDLPCEPDPALQAGLDDLVVEMGLETAARDGRLALAVADVTDPEQPRLAMVNGHEMFYAASLPKVAILLGAAVALEEGDLAMDPALERDLHDMIRVSCNACASRVLERVGRERLLDILQSPDYRFYDPELGGGLWVGKPYGPEPAYRRDPIDNQSHGATAYQAARFYYLLETGELVSPDQSELMLSALAEPGIDHKFVRGLAGHGEFELFRKSGSWRAYHADSVLIHSSNRAYIMVGLVEDGDGGILLENLAPRLLELLQAPPLAAQRALVASP